MQWKKLTNHPFAESLNRLVNRIGLIILGVLIMLHGAFVWRAYTTAETWEDRTFAIEHEWHYRLLNPLMGEALGFSVPTLGVAYVNQAGAERAGADVDGLRRHEAKHLAQVGQLGLRSYYQLAEWKREGVAEVVRGQPTANLCTPDPNETQNRLAYREYYVVTRYLMEVKGLKESDIYAYEADYPLDVAEAWLKDTVCR